MAYVLANIGTKDPGDGSNAVAVNSTSRAMAVDIIAGTFPSSMSVTVTNGTLAASTETIGHVIADASTATIGTVVLGATTETISVLALASTASIGHAVLDASTASIGSLAASTASIGHFVADASTASIGILGASTASIGHVVADTSTATIGYTLSKAGMSIVGMASVAPTTTPLVLPTTDGLSVTIPATTLRLGIVASAAGIVMNYASTETPTVPVPTTQLIVDCNATDAALLRFQGDSSKTISLIFQG